MDNHLLNYFLSCGPSKRFSAMAHGGLGDMPPLFCSPLSNRAILFKFNDVQGNYDRPRDQASDQPKLSTVRTLIYFPDNTSAPEKGGESIIYSPDALARYYDLVQGGGSNRNTLSADTQLFDIFDHVPTFNAFILRQAFERSGVPVPNGYFEVPPREFEMMKERIQKRLLPLVCAAIPNTETMSDRIAHLVDLLWTLNDPAGVAPLVKALRLPSDQAINVLSSWNGIAFFEHEYAKLERGLKEFAQWQAKYGMPRETLSKEVREMAVDTANRIKKRLMVNWKAALGTLSLYKETYENFVVGGEGIGSFLEFLNDSPSHFWKLGEAVAALEQIVLLWKAHVGGNEHQKLDYDSLMELYRALNVAN